MARDKWSPWRYIKNYKFNSLFLKNFILILALILVPLWIFCIAVYMYFQMSFHNELAKTAQSDLKRIQEIIDTTQLNMQTLCRNLAGDSLVIEYMQRDYSERINYEEAQELLQLMKNVRLMSNEYVDSIYLYSNNNAYVLSSENTTKKNYFYDMKWLETVREHTKYGGMYTWGRVREENSFLKNGERKTSPCITTGISVPVVPGRNVDGYIIMNMDHSWIERLVINNSSDYQNFFIIDSEDRILYNRDVAGVGEKMTVDYEDKDRYVVSESDSSIIGWKYVYVISRDGLQQKMDGLLRIILIAMILSTVTSVLLAYMISARVFLPVRSIIEMIDNPLEFYDMNSKEGSQTGNELRYITTAFMKNLKENTENREALTEYVTKLKQTQIALLQMQINPHFLFNIFQSISFMSVRLTRSDNDVSLAIEKLSHMLRSMIEVEVYLIPIEEELLYSKAYIELEQLRYKNEFSVQWNVPKELFAYLTVKMSLQPLLENCIRHGFKGKRAGQIITVTGKILKNEICFEVSDNGLGMEQSEVDRWNKELKIFQLIEGRHIGIRNVNQRIKMLFGDVYGLQLFHMERGLKVEVRIPVMREEEKNGKKRS